MIIKNSEQEALKSGAERIIRDGSTWRCYLPGEIPPPAVVAAPIVVSRLQFKKALTRAGFRAAFLTALSGMSQDVKDWFADADEIREDSPELLAVAAALSKTPKQVNDLMGLAATL